MRELFLLSSQDRLRARLRLHPAWRWSFAAILIGFSAGLSWSFAAHCASREHEQALRYAATISEFAHWAKEIGNRKTPLLNMFRALENADRQARVPVAPVLSCLERTIPEWASLEAIDWQASRSKAASLTVDVYVKKDRGSLNEWLERFSAALRAAGFNVRQGTVQPGREAADGEGDSGSVHRVQFELSQA